jgi:hypothetical protein
MVAGRLSDDDGKIYRRGRGVGAGARGGYVEEGRMRGAWRRGSGVVMRWCMGERLRCRIEKKGWGQGGINSAGAGFPFHSIPHKLHQTTDHTKTIDLTQKPFRRENPHEEHENFQYLRTCKGSSYGHKP